MKIYRLLEKVPSDALKTIKGGRMSGKSDISPQWRYERMTEVFGICGIGWKFEIVKQWTEEGSADQVFVFVNINLFVKVEKEWSDAIPANGGDILVVREKNGLYSNDEAHKMAITDALGTAMKMLGLAADVYRGKSDSKYSKPQQQVKADPVWLTEKQFNAICEGLKSDDPEIYKKTKVFYDLKLVVPFAMKKEYKTEIQKLIK